jgi:hypothetical protein
VCVAHGGGAPQVRRAARARLQREQLNRDVARLLDELDPEDRQHPVEILLEAVNRAASMGRLLDQLVGMLSPAYDPDRLDERGRVVAALWGPNHRGDAAPHVLVGLLGEWTDRQAKLAKTALDANVDERAVRLMERQIQELYEATQKAMALAGIVGDQADQFSRAMAAVLRGETTG